MKLFDDLDFPGVYGLVDPRRPHKIKYVGATARTLRQRYAAYKTKIWSGSDKLRAWLEELRIADLVPEMVCLERVDDTTQVKEVEQQWIAWASLFGPTLNREQGFLFLKNQKRGRKKI